MKNILELRSRLAAQQFEVFGDPSAIVAVKIGDESLARMMAHRLPDLGLLANLAEYPAVEKGAARFRLQVMAKHSSWEIQHAARCIRQAQSPL
jgi:glycine C-acetyltransferase